MSGCRGSLAVGPVVGISQVAPWSAGPTWWAWPALALALLLWPAARTRLFGLDAVRSRNRADASPAATARNLSWIRYPLLLGLIGVAAAAGPVVAAAAGVIGGTAVLLIRRARLRSGSVRCRTELIQAMRLLGGELRAGAPVVGAAEAAASGAGVNGRELMLALAASARIGVDTLTLPEEVSRNSEAVHRLQAAWVLCRRHGVPLADLVETVAEDLADADRADRRQAAELAGPRLSGYLLAGLPVVGLLLGTAMGADPVNVLLHSGIGQILLLCGAALTSAGLLWSARIAR